MEYSGLVRVPASPDKTSRDREMEGGKGKFIAPACEKKLREEMKNTGQPKFLKADNRRRVRVNWKRQVHRHRSTREHVN